MAGTQNGRNKVAVAKWRQVGGVTIESKSSGSLSGLHEVVIKLEVGVKLREDAMVTSTLCVR